MSLPPRLPYCSPARRQPTVQLFPSFRAPLTPPPSPASLQDPDSEPNGSTSEGCPEEAASFSAPGPRGRVFSGSAGANPQGRACQVPLSLPHVPPAQFRPRPGPPPAVAPAPSVSLGFRGSIRRPQPSRPPILNRRSSAPKSSRPAKDLQPAVLGGKEPEPWVSNQNEFDHDWIWRIKEITPPPLLGPRAAAKGGAAGRAEGPGGKKCAKLCKPASTLEEKYPATCRKIVLEVKKGVGKPR